MGFNLAFKGLKEIIFWLHPFHVEPRNVCIFS